MYLLRRLAIVANRKTTITAYYSLIYSNLKYGIIFWGSAANFIELFRFQKKCIRIIMNAKPRESCRQFFINLKLLTLPSLYIYETCCLVKSNWSFFQNHLTTHNYNTRNKNDLYVPFEQTSIAFKGTVNQAIKLYNSLPSNLKSLSHNFNTNLKTYLLEKCYYSVSDFIK